MHAGERERASPRRGRTLGADDEAYNKHAYAGSSSEGGKGGGADETPLSSFRVALEVVIMPSG